MAVNHLTLLVHDIVVFQEMFTDVKVMGLDFFLGVFDGPGHQAMLDGHPFFHAQTGHDSLNPVGAENAHQVVLQG